MYNYLENVKNDVKDYLYDEFRILNNEDLEKFVEENYNNLDEFEDELKDRCWCDDRITGNASGSYTFSSLEAEENLNGNWGLLVDCAKEFGEEPTISGDWKHGSEWWDVSIRCYLLSDAIAEVLEELE